MELPHVYVAEYVPEQLSSEDWDLPQVHHIEGNTICSADQPEQFDNGGLYMSPINQWIEASCANSA